MKISINKIQEVLLLKPCLPSCLIYFCFSFVLTVEASTQQLRIITVNEPPASYLDEKNLPQGYAVDIVQALKAKLSIETSIEFMPEARALNIARNRPNVLLFSFSRTTTREDNYLWVGQLLSKKWYVFTLDSSGIIIDNHKKLTQTPKIGVVRGDIREEWLVNHKFENLYSVTHHKQNIKMLLEQRVTAIVFEKAGLTQVCNELSIDEQVFTPQYVVNNTAVYLAMSQKTKHETFKKFHNAFNELTQEGVINNIATHWKAKLKQEFNIESELFNGILSF